MTEENMELTAASLKAVEQATAAHQALIDLAERRRHKLEETEQELKLVTMEVDRLRVDVHDLKARLDKIVNDNQRLSEARVAYETFVLLMARQLTEFVPPMPPDYAHRQYSLEGEGLAPRETPKSGATVSPLERVARTHPTGDQTHPRPTLAT